MSDSNPSYRDYRFPPQIINHPVWLYYQETIVLRFLTKLFDFENGR